MFFGAIEHFERALLRTNADPKTLIIRLRHVLFMGITGLLTLAEVIGKMQKRGVWVRCASRTMGSWTSCARRVCW